MTAHFGLDTGSQEGRWDWAKLTAWTDPARGIAPPRFAYLRGAVGLWLDPLLVDNIAGCETNGIEWTIYYVLDPDLPGLDQARVWIARTSRPRRLPRVVDYEARRRDGKIASATQLLNAFREIEQADGRTSMGYSRANVIDKQLATLSTTELNARWWALAQYLYGWIAIARHKAGLSGEHPGPPDLPSRLSRERVIIHQTADRLPPPPGASLHPQPSGDIDYNRWVGPMELDAFLGAPPPKPPPTLAELAGRVDRLEEMGHTH